jgi:xanthine dehydrogenase accessory factor
VSAPDPIEFARRYAALVEAGEPFAVATVVATEGSASARPGAKALVDAQGNLLFGWIGGGCAESTVRDEALAALADSRPRLLRLDLDDEVLGVGMPCGGYLNVFVEPVLPRAMLWILGHGAIAETLSRMGTLLGFHVTVDDPLASAEAFPTAQVRIADDPDYSKVECGPGSYVVITTQHKSDYEALERVLRESPAWVGLVASRKRAALLLERLHEDGFSLEQLRNVRSPCGLDVGSETPQEIALSILAEIVSARRGGASGQPLAERGGGVVTERGSEVPDAPARARARPPARGDRCPE